jgi:exonuclease V
LHLELERSKEYAPHSRKSSGFSTVELTEEELRLIEESVARLESKDSQFSPATGSENALSTHSTYSRPAYIEVALESPVPSTLVASPAPTVGRSPNPSPSIMASLYSLFRSSRKSLSVSDLVGPIWCEVQFDYGLRGGRHLPISQRPEVLQTRLGKEIQVQKNVAVENDRVLKKGTVSQLIESDVPNFKLVLEGDTQET